MLLSSLSTPAVTYYTLPQPRFSPHMPYCLGLHSAARAFLSAGFATHFTVAVIIFLCIVFITSSLEGDEVDAPVSLPGNSLLAIFPFFRKRYDFIKWGFHATGQNAFQFQLLRVSSTMITMSNKSSYSFCWQNKVIVVSGESARQAVFNAKGLDLTEGFKILSGAVRSPSRYFTFSPD